jgi:DNA invertase Pin-like site-specific DNA recombinase
LEDHFWAYEASRSVHRDRTRRAETDPFLLHIYAALAEKERRLISERTKAAMKRAKARGVRIAVLLGLVARQRHQPGLGFRRDRRLFARPRSVIECRKCVRDLANAKTA